MSAGAPGTGPAPATLGPRRRRFRARNLLAGLAILVCGMVIGSALTIHIGHRIMMRALGNPQKMAEHLTKRLQRELDLNPEQTAKVSAIIDVHAENISAIIRQDRPRLQKEFDSMHDEVSAQLNPEQKIKWDQRYEKMQKRFKQFSVPPPPSP